MRGQTLLLVIANPELASRIDRILDRTWKITSHTDGASGLLAALRGSFDAIVVEQSLARLDGSSIVLAVRKNAISTPILMIGPASKREIILGNSSALVDGYLVAPLDDLELMESVQALGEIARQRSPEPHGQSSTGLH
jgi:two-component system, OmpR family, response regulator